MAGDERGGAIGRRRQDRCAAQPPDCVLLRDIGCDMRGRAGHGLAADKLDDNAIRILQPDHRLAEFMGRSGCRHVVAKRPGEPETEAVRGDGKGDLAGLAMSDTAGRAVLPNEKCHQRSR